MPDSFSWDKVLSETPPAAEPPAPKKGAQLEDILKQIIEAPRRGKAEKTKDAPTPAPPAPAPTPEPEVFESLLAEAFGGTPEDQPPAEAAGSATPVAEAAAPEVAEVEDLLAEVGRPAAPVAEAAAPEVAEVEELLAEVGSPAAPVAEVAAPEVAEVEELLADGGTSRDKPVATTPEPELVAPEVAEAEDALAEVGTSTDEPVAATPEPEPVAPEVAEAPAPTTNEPAPLEPAAAHKEAPSATEPKMENQPEETLDAILGDLALPDEPDLEFAPEAVAAEELANEIAETDAQPAATEVRIEQVGASLDDILAEVHEAVPEPEPAFAASAGDSLDAILAEVKDVPRFEAVSAAAAASPDETLAEGPSADADGEDIEAMLMSLLGGEPAEEEAVAPAPAETEVAAAPTEEPRAEEPVAAEADPEPEAAIESPAEEAVAVQATAASPAESEAASTQRDELKPLETPEPEPTFETPAATEVKAEETAAPGPTVASPAEEAAPEPAAEANAPAQPTLSDPAVPAAHAAETTPTGHADVPADPATASTEADTLSESMSNNPNAPTPPPSMAAPPMPAAPPPLQVVTPVNPEGYQPGSLDFDNDEFDPNRVAKVPLSVLTPEVESVRFGMEALTSESIGKTGGDMAPLGQVHIDELLRIAVERKASDIHLTTGLPPMMRVDGEIVPLPYEVLTPEQARRLMYDTLSSDNLEKFERTHELDFSYSVKDLARFRVNVYMQRGSVAAALRMIPTRVPSFDELRLPTIIRDVAKRHSGLVLVTGPTGSGKSTTIASMIDDINESRNAHIMTIEDPIEYLHSHKKCMVNQREMHADTFSFHAALRAVLREDPDIILVGEMRDLETIEAALTLAETGHLVFGTLHTRNAPSTIDRVVDVFSADQQDQIRVLLGNTLEAVISQQLLPKLGGGRIASLEIMLGIPAIKNLIREGKTHQMYSIIETNSQVGMQTMDRSLSDLFRQGYVSYEECLQRSVDKETFARLAKGAA